MSLSFSRCTALFFLLRVSPTGFTAEVLMMPLGLYVFHFSSFMAFLCHSVLLACLLLQSAARGEVLQYLTHSALSRVESRHICIFRLFTFPAFLSKIRQYTQDFVVPSNFHHNLDICQLFSPQKIERHQHEHYHRNPLTRSKIIPL